MAITKPPVLPVWGETNTTSSDMVQPTDGQIQTGWPLSTTPPSRQRFNWFFNFVSNAVRYFSRRGIPDYDAAEEYFAGDTVHGDDGRIYVAQQNHSIANTPSSSPAWWGSPTVPTPPTDDNTAKVANCAYVLGQLSATFPVMDGTATIGTSLRFARADHVHPSDSSKANTSGSYAGLSVGHASSADTMPFSGITSKPNTCAGYGITDAITVFTIGTQSVFAAQIAGRAHPYRSDGQPIEIFYAGQPGQPNWLVGTNDGSNYYVWNPNNFSVNFATTAGNASHANSADFAGTATTQPQGTSNTSIATTQFVNPGNLFSATAGYKIHPDGLIEQWGNVSIGDVPGNPAFSGGFINFPIAFPAEILNIQMSSYDENLTVVGPSIYATSGQWSTTGVFWGIRETVGVIQNRAFLMWHAWGR